MMLRTYPEMVCPFSFSLKRVKQHLYCDYYLYAPDKKTQWALNTIDRTIDRIASERYKTVTEPVYSFTHDIYAHGLLVQHLGLMDLEDCALKEEEFYMFASLLMKNYNYWE